MRKRRLSFMRNRPVDGAATPRPAAAHPAPHPVADSFVKKNAGAITGAALGTAAVAANLATGGAVLIGASLGLAAHKLGKAIKDRFAKKAPAAAAKKPRVSGNAKIKFDALNVKTVADLKILLDNHKAKLKGNPQEMADFKNIIDDQIKHIPGIPEQKNAALLLANFDSNLWQHPPD